MHKSSPPSFFGFFALLIEVNPVRQVFLLLLPMLLLTAMETAIAADLPPNPGFEQADPTGTLPADWSERGTGGAKHTLSNTARTGRHSAQISAQTRTVGYFYSLTQPLPPTARLDASVWVKTQVSEGGAYLMVYYLTDKGYTTYSPHHPQTSTIGDTAGKWQRLAISDTPPPDALAWRISVQFDGVGTVWFDDAAVTFAPLLKLPEVSSATPAGKVLALADGRRAMVGKAVPVAAGLTVQATLAGRSGLATAVQVGALLFGKQGQLGVEVVPWQAWQQPTEVSQRLSACLGATSVRPIVIAPSAEAWRAITVSGLRAAVPQVITLAPAVLKPGPHPRLFGIRRALTAITQARQDPARYPRRMQAWTKLQAIADRCFTETEIAGYRNYNMKLPPTPPARRQNDPFPYWTGLSRALEVRLEALATAYLVTGDRKYADLARDWTLALCKWPEWTDPDDDWPDCCLDTGHFAYAAAFVYDFCYDALTDTERATIRRALLEKGAAPVKRAGTEGWARTMDWPNGFAVVMGGMGIAGLATLADDPQAEEYVQYSRQRISEFLGAQDRDGGYVEGLLYGGYAISHVVPVIVELDALGDHVLADHPYLAKTLRMAATCLQPGDQSTVDFCDAIYESRDYASLAAWRASWGDRVGQWYLQRAGLQGDLYQWTPPLALLWCPEDQPMEAPPGVSKVAHYRDIGWVIIRSGFGLADSLFALRSGYYGSHCHADCNSFMFNSGAQWVLQDPGYGRTQTSQHSTLLINGQDQTAGGQIVACGTAGSLTYAAGDATACYPELRRFVRHVLAVGGKYLLVADEVAAQANGTAVTSQLMTGYEEPQITNGVAMQAEGGQMVIRELTGQRFKVSEGEGPKKLTVDYTIGTAPVVLGRLIESAAKGGQGEQTTQYVARDGVAYLRLAQGQQVDHVFLNTTGSLRTLDGLTTDARALFIRTNGTQVRELSGVWGTRVTFHGKTLLQRATRSDFSELN